MIVSRIWYVLHVKPRTEKKVFGYLAGMRVFRYLPLLKKVTKVQRRRVVRYLPAFPGYVFTRLNADEKRRILETQMIVRMLDVPRPRQLIHELRQIEHARRTPAELRVAATYVAGQRVRVVTGPLRGLEGFVKREGRSSMLVLELSILGRALEASVEAADLQSI